MAENNKKPLDETAKKERAKKLYTRESLTHKAIAQKIGVDEKTVHQWVEEGKWELYRKSLMTSKQEQLNMLYDMLDLMNREGKKMLEDDDPETNPNVDGILKLATAIKKLETETGIGEMIDTLEALISFVQQEDFEAAQLINRWGDLFINDKLAAMKA